MAEALLIPYNLSIRITTDGFSFTLEQNNDTILKRHVYCSESMLHEKLVEEFQQQNLLGKHFQQTSVIVHSKSQLVPNELYRPEDKLTWFTSLHPTQRPQELVLMSQHIPEFGCHNIFSVPPKLYNTLQDAFGENIVYQHGNSLLIQTLLKKKDKHIAIYQHHNRIDMVVMYNGQLLLSNQFATQNETDIAYWVLNAIEQFKLPATLKTI